MHFLLKKNKAKGKNLKTMLLCVFDQKFIFYPRTITVHGPSSLGVEGNHQMKA